MGRLILFDKRGTGLSDRVSVDRLPDLETRMDDVRAVLDAVRSERSALIGISEGGAMATLFAATHPERAVALVLIGTFAREMRAPDYPAGVSEENLRRRLALLEDDDWATATADDWLGRVAPDAARDAAARRWHTSYLRRGASPGATKALRLMNAEIDIRGLLATISVPTLVLHRENESLRDGSRFMGRHIPGARTVELPGRDHLPWEGDAAAVLDEIERFVTGARDDLGPDRVLLTLLVTDVDGSAAEVTDSGGRDRQEPRTTHRRLVRAHVDRFRGREVEVPDDGTLAVFDGPARAVRCAAAIVDALRTLGLHARAGVHTGEVEQVGGRVQGIAVEVAARIAGVARPGEVVVSSTVKDIVAGSGLAFAERDAGELAAFPGTLRLFTTSS